MAKAKATDAHEPGQASSEQSDSFSMHNRYAIQSIEKSLDVIEALSEHDALSLLQLAELVSQPKPSLFRILLTLEKRGYINRNEDGGLYSLGFKQLVITKRLLERSTIRGSAVAEMQKLVDRFGDTVNLCVLLEDQITYVEIIEGTYALRMTDQVGSKAPLHATAAGKAITAFLPEQDVRGIAMRTGLPPHTPNTITSLPALLAELAQVRQLGYAVDHEEIVLGARCVAAPVFNMFGQAEGAVSLSGALHRFPEEQLAAIAEEVKLTASQISSKLGYNAE